MKGYSYSQLQKKNPQQLVDTLRWAGYNKQKVIGMLVDYEIEKEPILQKMTFLQLCKEYKEDIIEYFWEELENGKEEN